MVLPIWVTPILEGKEADDLFCRVEEDLKKQAYYVQRPTLERVKELVKKYSEKWRVDENKNR